MLESNGTRNAAERHIYGRIRQNAGRGRYLALSFFVFGGVLLALLSMSAQPAAAQIAVTPTPLPAVVATQQAANNAAAHVNDLQAERAQTQARLDEINRNIEAQIAEAERAANEARAAAATQNAVETGAAIGRLEGAIAQLRASYAGKDAIIADMAARLDAQAAQHITDTRTIDNLTAELRQARNDKQTALNAYNALSATKQAQSNNEMALNAVYLIVALAFLLAMITLAAFVLQRRRDMPNTPATPEIVDVDYIVNEDGTQ